jgi:hypothetical protein
MSVNIEKLFGIIPMKKEVSLAGPSVLNPGERSKDPRLTPFDAGADILYRYQVQWSRIHEETVLASKIATQVEESCAHFSQQIKRRANVIAEFNSLLKCVHSLESDIDLIEQDLKETIESLQSLEDAIDAKKECLFDEELKKKFDSQYVLKIHEQRLNREFEKITKSLVKEHSKRVEQLKKTHAMKIEQKQREFQAAFEKEVMEYKTKGQIPSSSSDNQDSMKASSPSLEEIVVQADEADQETLEKFLQENEES